LPWSRPRSIEEGSNMQNPISLAPLLWNHQTTRPMNNSITHGKGRKGIIICSRRSMRAVAVKRFLSWGKK